MKTSLRWSGALAPLFLRWSILSLALFTGAITSFGQANGKLQIHYIDVSQGDGALLISPNGQTVMFDSGAKVAPHLVSAYLQQLGVTHIDFLITSHYHADHCGAVAELVAEVGLPGVAYDRGQPTNTVGTFSYYDGVMHSVRKTVMPGTSLILDQGSANPVKIDFVADNGNGVATHDENDQSVDCVVHFGDFDAEFGGDLSGFEHMTYHDIETSVAPKVGQVEVYKVHHHGSAHSTNTTWLSTIKPKIGIISCGKNDYGHPTAETLTTLHDAGVVTYWTEVGQGVQPVQGQDYIGGNIVVQVPVGGSDFTVNFGTGQSQHYNSWGHDGAVAGGTTTSPTTATTTVTTTATTTTAPAATTYVWSKKSHVYHYADCSYANSISAENRQTGTTPPADSTLHSGCPR